MRPSPARALALAFGLTLSTAAQLACGEPALPAMNSYGQPPFMAMKPDSTPGLAGTFVDLLNQALEGHSKFRLENLPRRRLEAVLGTRSFEGLALFLTPEFLASPAQQGAAWSEPVMMDENLIVSVRPLKLSSLEDLHGLKLGGIAGHVYGLLAAAVDEGRLTREDAPDHVSNLRKLCLGRVDFVVISRSELAGMRPHVSCAEPFRPMAFPQPQVIVRRVLVRMPDRGSASEVLEAVAAVACGPRWGQALAQYGLSTAGCLSARARGSDSPARPPGPR